MKCSNFTGTGKKLNEMTLNSFFTKKKIGGRAGLIV
jgi:hypothetical protein